MNYTEILDKWAKYTSYNPEQTSFNLRNYSYELHNINKRMEYIIETYDETGALAIIQAKIMFLRMLKDGTYNALDYMKNPHIVDQDKEIWNMFHSTEVLDAETSYIEAINKLSDDIIGKTMIGVRDDEKVLDELFDATDIVMDSLKKCHLDLFLRGGKILPIEKFSTHIHLFETLAECLTVLESADDALYLCYINCGGTADGYFGFALKNNGNLLFINERVNEAYSGQHGHSRNGRWSNDKRYALFPYNYIFDFTEHDYKGYATKHLINDEKLAFFDLGAKAYFPLIIAMLMINKQYAGKMLDMDLRYIDSLLPQNLSQISDSNHALMLTGKNALVQSHQALDLSFDLDRVMSGDYAKEFDYDNKKDYRETGIFSNSNQLFVNLWGQGFSFDPAKIYETKSILRIASEEREDEEIPPEFVGTKKRIRLQGYYQIRKQLADYIRKNIHTAWIAFGKTPAVKHWYIKQIESNMDEIEKLVGKEYLRIQNGGKRLSSGCHSRDEESLDIYYEEQRYPSGFETIILNEKKEKYDYLCFQTGAICTLFFTFAPKNWKQIESLCGCEVPKIIKGWNCDGHFGDGNSNLEATDMVTQVGTPFEKYEEDRYWNNYKESDVYFPFIFSIGFSKRGLKQIIQKHSLSKIFV